MEQREKPFSIGGLYIVWICVDNVFFPEISPETAFGISTSRSSPFAVPPSPRAFFAEEFQLNRQILSLSTLCAGRSGYATICGPRYSIIEYGAAPGVQQWDPKWDPPSPKVP